MITPNKPNRVFLLLMEDRRNTTICELREREGTLGQDKASSFSHTGPTGVYNRAAAN